jgi:glycosyltransferase involved in cell wall biosynthesis
MSGPTLGLAMICQDDAFHIAPSIAQFFTVVDDIVVVDGGSLDDSAEWAEKMGARVFHRPFDNDFAAQKNYALGQLETDWIYLHDPDERLEPAMVALLPHLIDKTIGHLRLKSQGLLPEDHVDFDCFGIARKNFIDGLQTEIYPDYQYRLFENKCRFERPVHEELVGWGHRTEVDYKKAALDMPSRFNILHYKSSAKQAAQDAQYAKIEEKYALETLETLREKAKEEGDENEHA